MKTKFNIIDVIIIVAIVLIIVAGCFFYFNMNKDSAADADTVKINFVLEVNNLTETSAISFENSVGDAVTLGATSSGSGVIKKAEKTGYKKWVKNVQDGEVVLSEVPDRYTVRLTIESDVVKSGTAFTTGNETIAVGKAMPFNANGVASEDCYIVDLIEVK